MSSVETFIVVAALVSSLFGGIILLSSLAGKRAQLVRAFNIQQELHAQQASPEPNPAPDSEPHLEDDLDLTAPE